MKLAKTLKKAWKWLSMMPKNLLGTLKCVWVYWFGGVKKPQIFKGYWHWHFAQWYANKRHRRWKSHWDQLGKWQYVFPYGEEHLLVCSKREMKFFQRKKIFDIKRNYTKVMKSAYYSTRTVK